MKLMDGLPVKTGDVPKLLDFEDLNRTMVIVTVLQPSVVTCLR